MRASILCCLWLLCQLSSLSQGNSSILQTWMKGDNTISNPGIYGTKGLPDPSNKPGARDFSATWRDADGNLWLFGGYGLDGSGNSGYLNDLWKFEPDTRNWTWIHGDNSTGQLPVCGTKGVASATNKPGAVYASVSWTGTDGSFWLFGGFGYTSAGEFGFLNSLWKYDPQANQWTWMKGDDNIDEPARYGTRGIPHVNNKPGARYGSLTWTDSNGNLWLLGGFGYDAGGVGSLNDLWKYDPATNRWAWISGDNLVNQRGKYGTKGTSDPANKPGARFVSITWKDSLDNLWLFGGSGMAATEMEGNLNDVWKYNIQSNSWTWINGDSSINKKAVYGSLGTPAAGNKPGARYLGISWSDANHDVWLFGGYGYDQTRLGYLNDLWRYDPSSNQWTWEKGDSTINQAAVYGTLGMPTITNKSGARTSGVSWTDNDGHLWLFGGYGYDASTSGMLNDLWKISSFIVLPVRLLNFSGRLNPGSVELTWQSSQELSFSHYLIEKSVDGLRFDSIGKKQAAGGSGSQEYRFVDGSIDGGDAFNVFYRLKLVNIDGSFSYSRIIRFYLNKKPSAAIYPNPATDLIYLSLEGTKTERATFTIFDIGGRKRYGGSFETGFPVPIDIAGLAAGNYILSVNTAAGTTQQRFVKL